MAKRKVHDLPSVASADDLPADFGAGFNDPFMEWVGRLRALLAEAVAKLEPFAAASESCIFDNAKGPCRDDSLVAITRIGLASEVLTAGDFRAAASLAARIRAEIGGEG